MKLLIIRHGDPDYSIDSLTETGFLEADLLAAHLKDTPIDAIYCSPLGRARDTARPTAAAKGMAVTVLDWLREFDPAVDKPNRKASVAWDWLPQDWANCPAFYHPTDWKEHPAFTAAGVGEAAAAVWQGLDELLALHGYRREGNLYRAEVPNEKTIALFCHFGVTAVLLSHLLGISPMPLWHGTCAAPTSVTRLVTEERREGIAAFRMGAFGDTSHLAIGGREPSFAARFCETFANQTQRHD